SDDLQDVPIGVSGEIFVAGDSIARGYTGRPDLTAEKFVPDTLSGRRGARVYRTGDVGRRLPDGSIEFLGRVDDQIKVRGFRVELKEIEAAIRCHPAVAEAVVLHHSRNEGPGRASLEAYVRPVAARARSIQGMARYRLPNNMAIAQVNKNETDYLYREIFELQAYLRSWISLTPGMTVLDVGANVGMFTLFVKHQVPDAKVYAFEPNPEVFKVLNANLLLYAPEAQRFGFGLSNHNREADF